MFPASVVCDFASLSATRLRCTNAAKRCEVLLAVEILGDLGTLYSMGSPTDSMRPSPNYFSHSLTRGLLSMFDVVRWHWGVQWCRWAAVHWRWRGARRDRGRDYCQGSCPQSVCCCSTRLRYVCHISSTTDDTIFSSSLGALPLDRICTPTMPIFFALCHFFQSSMSSVQFNRWLSNIAIGLPLVFFLSFDYFSQQKVMFENVSSPFLLCTYGFDYCYLQLT